MVRYSRQDPGLQSGEVGATRVLYHGSDAYARRFLHAALETGNAQPDLHQESDLRAAIDLVGASVWTLIVADCREVDSDTAPGLVRGFRRAAPLTALLVLARPGAATLDEILALRAGADDWLVFPLPQEELTERCHALVRRVSRQAPPGEVRNHGPLTLDESQHELTGPGGTVSLTCTETRLLSCLLQQPGICVPQAELLSAVWDSGPALGRDQVKVGAYRLRQKLRRVGINGFVIESHRGLGYRINLPDAHC